MKTLFVILFFGLLLFSCGKERSITIKAINAATGQAYAGLEYRVASSRTGINGEKYRTEASGVLDANGMAVVNIKQKKGRTYSVRVVEPANNCYNKEATQYFDSPFDVNGTFTFEFAECAYLNININNLNCQGITDKMNFRSKYSYTEWESWSTDRLGCYSVSSIEPIKVPSGWRIYNWSVNRNGNITNYFDSIFLSPGSVNGIININY